jgi:hypothetical protein
MLTFRTGTKKANHAVMERTIPAPDSPPEIPRPLVSRRTRMWIYGLGAAISAIVAFCWAITEPVTPETKPLTPQPSVASKLETIAARAPTPAPPATPSIPEWPAGRMDGMLAKEKLLAVLVHAEAKLSEIEGYKATFYKQEQREARPTPDDRNEGQARAVRHLPQVPCS